MKITAPTPLPTPLLALPNPPPPLLPLPKKGKNKKSWIWILWYSLNVHNFTGTPSSAPNPLPTPLLALPNPPPPPLLPIPKKGKNKKSWIWILWYSLNVHNFTGTPSSAPNPDRIPPLKKIPWFGFFVKIHLLESLKLELYEFRSYSFMIIYFWKYGLYEMCWWFLGWFLVEFLSLLASTFPSQRP